MQTPEGRMYQQSKSQVCYTRQCFLVTKFKIFFFALNLWYSQSAYDLWNALYTQWGSEIWSFKIWKYLEFRLFGDYILNGPVFEGFGYILLLLWSWVWRLFLTKWQPFVWILNGIWNPDDSTTSILLTIENRTRLVFGSSLYWGVRTFSAECS